MKVDDGRVFVDLVHETSECFGNWSPNQSVKVGDYGVLNRKTAEFEKEGSIYDADFRPELQIGKNHPVLEGATEGQYIIVSRGCSAEAFDADFSECVIRDLHSCFTL
ncbi:hypothetical protein EWM64_g510 [Hericium alpestre]|uniref:Uncharacterized protein n=1 Tax=Hericium alpestre TaxID=135208 RepID=A0A4Z0AAX5_9AGAM|nr:hypothetical protein EWM64_g510 [Hericium alpestre]